MAEEESGQEKTEEATPRKLEKAREEGQVPRSRELGAAVTVIIGSAGLLMLGDDLVQTMAGIARDNFSLDARDAWDEGMMFAHLRNALVEVLVAIGPFLALLMLAGLIGPITMSGWLISGKALMPKFSRISPMQGLKRMFSMQAVVELLKSILKVLVLAGISLAVLRAYEADLLGLGNQSPESAMVQATSILAWSLLFISSGLVLIAAVDVPYQMFDFAKKMRMTMQEIKDEMKDIEGKPEVKGRVRQLQREMANRRMMQAVPEADVVITNPTHYSVALKYDTAGAGAPVLVAKGADMMAFKIREIAEAHQVTVVSSPALARAVYFTTEVDQEIPQRLYVAVAKVLAYVFQLKSFRERRGRRPILPGERELGVPDDLRFDDKA